MNRTPETSARLVSISLLVTAMAQVPSVAWAQMAGGWSPNRDASAVRYNNDLPPDPPVRRTPVGPNSMRTTRGPGQSAGRPANRPGTAPRMNGQGPVQRVRHDVNQAGNPLPRYARADVQERTVNGSPQRAMQAGGPPRERLATRTGYAPSGGPTRVAARRTVNGQMGDHMTYDGALSSGGESVPGNVVDGGTYYEGGSMGGHGMPSGGCASCQGGGGGDYGGGCSDCGDFGGGCSDCGDCGGGCGSCGGCGGGCVDECGNGGPRGHHWGYNYRPWWGCCGPWGENLTLFGGVHGFKGGPDQGVNSNFGFHEGFNWGMPLFPHVGWGAQAGGSIHHSDLSGYNIGGVTTSSSRTQYFVTAGLFRRSQGMGPYGGGHQWGVVGDYMADDFYANMRFGQVRAEASWLFGNCHELGFWGAFGAGEDTQVYRLDNQRRIIETWQPQNLYAFFWRANWCCQAQTRLWGGFTGNGDGMVGGDAWAPVSDCLSLQGGFNYIIPDDTNNHLAEVNHRSNLEGWNVSINIVWHPAWNARCQGCNPWRPLLPVADNSVFMLNRLAGSGAVAP